MAGAPVLGGNIHVADGAISGNPMRFQRHDIDTFPGGYQVAVADINGDGKLDVVALSTSANRVDWYENPGWQRRPVARAAAPIDLAVRDINGDGKPEIALASGFYFAESKRGGLLQCLRRPADLEKPWKTVSIGADPVTHRVRWADLDGDGRLELVHAPILGPGSQGQAAPKPSHLWAFRVPEKLDDPWPAWIIDESLTVLHGLYVGDLDGDGRDELLTASFEGIFRFDYKGSGSAAGWRKTHIATGARPENTKPGAARGTSEVVPGRLDARQGYLAAIEPWHGHQVVVYTPGRKGESWQRRVVDETLSEGHALVVADFDGDGQDEMVAGWRGAGGGLRLYDPVDAAGSAFRKIDLDRGITVEGAVAADLNGDGRLDLVVIAGRTNNLAWYENQR
jgi:hypothetical protein